MLVLGTRESEALDLLCCAVLCCELEGKGDATGGHISPAVCLCCNASLCCAKLYCALHHCCAVLCCAVLCCAVSQVVLEGPVVNTSVTGPAAAMALMMTYLKTGDADVAARFRVSDIE